jgi:3-hydroxybutyryl-CoA dehydrogenase
VLDDVAALAQKLDKTPVVCGDKAGFIANTLLFGYLNHAVSMYEARYASREDIDAAMRFGCGYPMGPLALLDLIGLDGVQIRAMYKQGRDRLHAHPDPQAWSPRGCSAEVGRGFHYEDTDSRRGDAAHRRPASCTRDQRSAWSLSPDTGIIEVFASEFPVTVGRSDDKVAGPRPSKLDGDQRGKSTRSQGRSARATHRHHRIDDLGRHRRRAIAETSRSRPPAEPRRDLQAGAILATTTSARSSRWPGDARPQD